MACSAEAAVIADKMSFSSKYMTNYKCTTNERESAVVGSEVRSAEEKPPQEVKREALFLQGESESGRVTPVGFLRRN